MKTTNKTDAVVIGADSEYERRLFRRLGKSIVVVGLSLGLWTAGVAVVGAVSPGSLGTLPSGWLWLVGLVAGEAAGIAAIGYWVVWSTRQN